MKSRWRAPSSTTRRGPPRPRAASPGCPRRRRSRDPAAGRHVGLHVAPREAGSGSGSRSRTGSPSSSGSTSGPAGVAPASRATRPGTTVPPRLELALHVSRGSRVYAVRSPTMSIESAQRRRPAAGSMPRSGTEVARVARRKSRSAARGATTSGAGRAADGSRRARRANARGGGRAPARRAGLDPARLGHRVAVRRSCTLQPWSTSTASGGSRAAPGRCRRSRPRARSARRRAGSSRSDRRPESAQIVIGVLAGRQRAPRHRAADLATRRGLGDRHAGGPGVEVEHHSPRRVRTCTAKLDVAHAAGRPRSRSA